MNINHIPFRCHPVSISLVAATAIFGLALLFALLFFASRSIDAVLAESEDIVTTHLPKVHLIHTTVQEELLSILSLRDVPLHAGRAERERLIAQGEKHAQQAQAALAQFERMVGTELGHLLHIQAAQARATLADAKSEFASDVAALPLPTPRTQALAPTISEMRHAVLAYFAQLDELQELQEQRTNLTAGLAWDHAAKARIFLVVAWLVAGVTLVLVGVSWRCRLRAETAARDRRIAALSEQRDTLVREVHHRIKNHLQGLVGLIESQQALRPEIALELAALHGHALALAGVHGLQARTADAIDLTELVRQQAALLRQSDTGFAARIAERAGPCAWRIHDDQAVVVALAVTELLMNARKHGAGEIAVELEQNERGGRVSIDNPVRGQGVADDITDAARGAGLALVKALLAGIGELSIDAGTSRFRAVLTLRPADIPGGG